MLFYKYLYNSDGYENVKKYVLLRSTLSEVFVSVISSLNFGPTPISPTDIEIGSLEEIGAKDFLSIRTSSRAAKKFSNKEF